LARTWITGTGAVLVGVLAALCTSEQSHTAEMPPASLPGIARAPREPPPGPHAAEPSPHLVATPHSDATAPELERRLHAARSTVAVPAPRPPDPAGHPTDPAPPPLSPEQHAARQIALAGWAEDAQHMLDDCLARPAAQRRSVALAVMFAPVTSRGDAAAAQLSPVAISVPVEDLRRLWRDTQPDALDDCLERVRGLGLAVRHAPGASSDALVASAETVVVAL
jgi:hypothetical protein